MKRTKKHLAANPSSSSSSSNARRGDETTPDASTEEEAAAVRVQQQRTQQRERATRDPALAAAGGSRTDGPSLSGSPDPPSRERLGGREGRERGGVVTRGEGRDGRKGQEEEEEEEDEDEDGEGEEEEEEEEEDYLVSYPSLLEVASRLASYALTCHLRAVCSDKIGPESAAPRRALRSERA
eukprot:1231546-Rhodomonas_salina.2